MKQPTSHEYALFAQELIQAKENAKWHKKMLPHIEGLRILLKESEPILQRCPHLSLEIDEILCLETKRDYSQLKENIQFNLKELKQNLDLFDSSIIKYSWYFTKEICDEIINQASIYNANLLFVKYSGHLDSAIKIESEQIEAKNRAEQVKQEAEKQAREEEERLKKEAEEQLRKEKAEQRAKKEEEERPKREAEAQARAKKAKSEKIEMVIGMTVAFLLVAAVGVYILVNYYFIVIPVIILMLIIGVVMNR